MLKKLLSTILFMALFVPAIALAQTGSIEGTVIDAESGETVPGANVMLVEVNRGSATDADGNYEISDVEAGTYTLRVTFVGYTTYNKQVTITANETLTHEVQLQMGAVGLDEVVVTGYGEVSSRSFTGSVSQVSTEDMESIPVTSVTQSLQGAAPGLQISSVSGTPGSAQELSIRGISSINADTDPLFVVDGVPVESGGDLQVSSATSSLGLLSSLNPSDIESISVLKDASATAQYGARGANGVIVITTKKGIGTGDTRFSFSAERGASQQAISGPDPLTASQWDELYTESLLNAGYTEAQAQSPWDGETNTNWGDIATDDNAVSQKYNFSASGGTEKSTYFASLGFQDQEGVSQSTHFNRLSGRLNYGYQLRENISLDNNFSGSYVDQEGALEGSGYFGNPVLAKYFMLPIDKAYNKDGSYNINNLSAAVFHPLYTAENDIDKKNTYRILNNTTLQISLLDNFDFTSKVGLDYVTNEEKYYDNPVHGDGATTAGAASVYYTRNFNWTWQNMFDYELLINADHNIDFKLLQEAQKNNNYVIATSGQGFATTGLTNLSSSGTPTQAYSYSEDWSVLAFMGSAKYGFRDKVYVDASYRYEGNSRFASGNRWGSFWALGSSYIISEDFLQDAEWLDFLKVRASYGVTGNAAIGLNEYQAFLGYGAAYGGAAGIVPAQLGNQTLSWEKATSLDLGMDVELLNRISAGVTYFTKESNDLLFDVPLSYTTGHSQQRQNIGSLTNNGWEANLDVDVIQATDIQWNLGASFTYVQNEVTDLPKDANGEDIVLTSGYKNRAVNGYEVGAWYMKKWAGVDPQNGQPLWYVNGKNGATTSNYNEAEEAYQGASAMPTHFGSVNTRLNVKGFFLSANIYYSLGNKVYDGWANYMMSDGTYAPSFNQYSMQYNRWQEPGDQTNVPKLQYGHGSNSNSISSRFLYDGGYLRLQNLKVGYNIPPSLMENLNFGLSSASLYITGRNLMTHVFDDELKFDPDIDQTGFLDLYNSPLKTYTLGLSVNF